MVVMVVVMFASMFPMPFAAPDVFAVDPMVMMFVARHPDPEISIVPIGWTVIVGTVANAD